MLCSFMRFSDQPTLTGDMLHLRRLQAADHASLSQAASDPSIWAGHPARDRYKPDVFATYFDMLLTSGGTLVVQDRASGATIGCSRYYPVPESDDDIGIGFTFLTTAYWGGPANLELKTLMLDHAFAQVDRVWFHIDPANIRSQKATAKLGAHHVCTRERPIGDAKGLWMCFALDKSTWQSRKPQASGSA